MTIRLIIADDDPIIREGLKVILGLDADFEVLACVENGLQAVEYCINHPVEVALLRAGLLPDRRLPFQP